MQCESSSWSRISSSESEGESHTRRSFMAPILAWLRHDGGDRTTCMDGDEALDEKAIIARVRERLRVPLGTAPLPPIAPRPEGPVDASPAGLEVELAALRGTSDI